MTTDPARRDVARSDAYRLLAACFCEPERELFLAENLGANLAALMEELAVPAREPCRRLAEGLDANSQEELFLEYTALFLGPFGAPAHPYGSVYLDQARQLMGDSTMVAKKMYQAAGITQEVEGPPDHICLELEFMSYLTRRIAQALADGDEAVVAEFSRRQRDFYTRCLARWVTPFCNAIRDNAQLPFYRALADCLGGFIAAERRHVQEMATTPVPAA